MLIQKPRIPICEILLYGLWPGFFKILLYRLKGYRIGKHVSIGFGSVICGSHIEVGDHTSIGFLTFLRGTEIRLGPYVQIGAMTFLDTPYITIGEGSRVNEQVFVGGLQFPDSRFVLGRNCLVQQMAFINPAPSVIVGDDAVIGGHSLVFGHSSWQSQLEGYTVDFGPIEIGKSASLAWRVFVLPRTRIGDGAVVGANSVVSGEIPPRCVAVGFPARVVRRGPDFPKQLSEQDRLTLFGNIISDMIGFFVASGLKCIQKDDYYEISKPNTAWWRRRSNRWILQVTDSDAREAIGCLASRVVHVFVSLRKIPEDVRSRLDRRSIMWVDISQKRQSRHANELGDEVLRFLQRYGVRTLRSEWDSPPSASWEAR